MSKVRQLVSPHEPHVRTAAVGFSPGYQWRSQDSRWGQLLYTSRGTMSVDVPSGAWVVPPTEALWLPPGHANAVSLSGHGSLCRVYLRGAPCARLPREVRVVKRSALLAELLRRVMESGTLDHRRAREGRLIEVLVDELTIAHAGSIELPMPHDARAMRAAELMRRDPALARDADAVARAAGASVRTLERLFARETGLSFGAWRQRARVLQSLVYMADGETVTRTALAVGYASASAFVVAFKAVMGATPRGYRGAR